MYTDTLPVPEIFQHHVGTWKGEFIKTNTKGNFISSFMGKFRIKIEGINYYQTNEYEYPDGKQLKLEFMGKFENGVLKLGSNSSSDVTANVWDCGQNIIQMISTKKQNNSLIKYIETITLIDENHRVRSTQEFKDGVFTGINFIEEARIS